MRTTKLNEQFELTIWVSLIRLSETLNNLSVTDKQNNQSYNSANETSNLIKKLIITALIGLFSGFLSGLLLSNF